MSEESLKIDLKIHKGKTKFLTNVDTTDNIQIDWTEIEKLANDSNGKQNRARSFEKNKSRMECFWKVQRNRSRQTPFHESEMKSLQPVWLTSNGIWILNIVLTKALVKKLATSQQAMERKILDNKIRNVTRQRTDTLKTYPTRNGNGQDTWPE